MTSRADFEPGEWDLLVQAPRWVVAAASAAQRDLAYRTDHEIEAGYVATAKGSISENAFVTGVAAETMKIFDSRTVVGATDFADRAAGVSAVLERVASAARLLAEKAQPADAEAYGRWLLEITEVVITAARSKDILGFGGQLVTEKERDFRERLAQTLRP